MRAVHFLLFAFVLTLGASQAQEVTPTWKGPRGFGMHPVSPEIAALWYRDEDITGKDSLVFMLYMRGKAGWHDQKTDFKHDSSPQEATMRIFSGDTVVVVEFSRKTNDVRLFGRRVDLSKDNVILAEPVGEQGKFPSVIGLGRRNLKVVPDTNPSIDLLERDKELEDLVLSRKAAATWRCTGLDALAFARPVASLPRLAAERPTIRRQLQ